MIEVEKKFQPTEEQLEKMLEGAEFLGEVFNNDVFFDYPDFRLLKRGIKFRKRNGSFELKIKLTYNADTEIEEEEEIKKYFTTDNLLDFIDKNLILYMEYDTKRKKYQKEGFKIDVDELSFGIKSCDVELLVENKEEVKQAEEKIFSFAERFGFEFKDLLSKREEYLKRFKPELYKELFGEK